MSFTHVSSRRFVATIGLFAAGVAFFVPLPMSASSESACEAMARWATEYERTTPAPTLDELAKFDRGRRVAIFNAVSAEVKASLFQEQLRRFSQRADLTAAQRALIAEGLTLITPALYRKEPAAMQAARQFWSRAESSFTSPDQRRPWYRHRFERHPATCAEFFGPRTIRSPRPGSDRREIPASATSR